MRRDVFSSATLVTILLAIPPVLAACTPRESPDEISKGKLDLSSRNLPDHAPLTLIGEWAFAREDAAAQPARNWPGPWPVSAPCPRVARELLIAAVLMHGNIEDDRLAELFFSESDSVFKGRDTSPDPFVSGPLGKVLFFLDVALFLTEIHGTFARYGESRRARICHGENSFFHAG